MIKPINPTVRLLTRKLVYGYRDGGITERLLVVPVSSRKCFTRCQLGACCCASTIEEGWTVVMESAYENALRNWVNNTNKPNYEELLNLYYINEALQREVDMITVIEEKDIECT